MVGAPCCLDTYCCWSAYGLMIAHARHTHTPCPALWQVSGLEITLPARPAGPRTHPRAGACAHSARQGWRRSRCQARPHQQPYRRGIARTTAQRRALRMSILPACTPQMSAALNMMNSAVDGGPPPSSWTAPPPAAAGYGAPPAGAPAAAHYDASDLTLRQVSTPRHAAHHRRRGKRASGTALLMIRSPWRLPPAAGAPSLALALHCTRLTSLCMQRFPSRACSQNCLGLFHAGPPFIVLRPVPRPVLRCTSWCGLHVAALHSVLRPILSRSWWSNLQRRRALRSCPSLVARTRGCRWAPLWALLRAPPPAPPAFGPAPGASAPCAALQGCRTGSQRLGRWSALAAGLPAQRPTARPAPLPLSRRRKQMYGFGLVSCVVDNAQNVVKAQLGSDRGWATVSLEQLLAEHERRAAAARRAGRA